jgi:hypothetical protein
VNFSICERVILVSGRVVKRVFAIPRLFDFEMFEAHMQVTLRA